MSRVRKTLLNMRINLATYFVAILISFFTRKVFLDRLGDEFIGLTTTINSLLGFLNLAELGVAASIAYFLYRPIYDDDRSRICQTLSIMGFLYRRIGLFIFGGGVLLSLLLPWVFSDANIPWGIIYYCFYVQLFASLLGYFVNYRANTLFAADQRQYLVNGYFQLTQFVTVILQAVIAYYTASFALYITLSLLFAIVNSLILNRKFRQVYPWVTTDLREGREALTQRPEILRYVRRVFIHQIGKFVNVSAMPLVIYGYASLSMVTFYGNYTLINNKISSLIYSALNGTGASVGNLIAEGNRSHIYDCYRELYSIKFFVVTYLSLCLVRLCSPFIAVWLGAEYLLPSALVILICADFCLNLLRNTTDQYLDGYGLKADVWVPLCRIATLGVMVICGSLWGLIGILSVPVVFQLLFMHLWKPYYLYRSGFQLPFGQYLRLLLANLLPFVISFVAVELLLHAMGYGEMQPSTWGSFFAEAFLFAIPLLVISAPLAYLMCDGIRLFVRRTRCHKPA